MTAQNKPFNNYGLFYTCKDKYRYTYCDTAADGGAYKAAFLVTFDLDASAIQEYDPFIYSALDQTAGSLLGLWRAQWPHIRTGWSPNRTPKTIRCKVTHHATLTADKQRFLLPQTLKVQDMEYPEALPPKQILAGFLCRTQIHCSSTSP